MSGATKRCPYCAEEIKAEAVKCRYCGEFLERDAIPGAGTPPGGGSIPGHVRNAGDAIGTGAAPGGGAAPGSDAGTTPSAAPGRPVPPPEPKPRRYNILVVVLAALGLLILAFMIFAVVAAIAIPSFLRARDVANQQKTLADMRTVASGNATMYAETGRYAAELAELERGGYLQSTPATDAWQNAWIYRVEGDHWLLASLGSDGAEGPPPPDPWEGSAYDSDIIMLDGAFTQAPALSAQR